MSGISEKYEAKTILPFWLCVKAFFSTINRIPHTTETTNSPANLCLPSLLKSVEGISAFNMFILTYIYCIICNICNVFYTLFSFLKITKFHSVTDVLNSYSVSA